MTSYVAIDQWPGYVPPKKDELLSSWLFRNSKEHVMKPFSFTKHYFNNAEMWSRDIDKALPEKIIEAITTYTPLSKGEVKNMQLSSYENIVFEGPYLPNIYNYLLTKKIYHA